MSSEIEYHYPNDRESKEDFFDDTSPGPMDLVGIYFRQTKDYPQLTKDEEISLAIRIEKGKEAKELLKTPGVGTAEEERQSLLETIENANEARRQLSQANGPLDISIAKKYVGMEIPFPDLIQEGNIGLMKAVDKYDYKRGTRFSTYATYRIRQTILRLLDEKSRQIRVPASVGGELRRLKKKTDELEQKLGRKHTFKEIADKLGASPEKVESLSEIDQRTWTVSLQTPVGENGKEELGDFLQDEEALALEDLAEISILKEKVREIIFDLDLDPRDVTIVLLKYGFIDNREFSLEEIGQMFGTSRETIRKQLNKIHHKIKQALIEKYGFS